MHNKNSFQTRSTIGTNIDSVIFLTIAIHAITIQFYSINNNSFSMRLLIKNINFSFCLSIPFSYRRRRSGSSIVVLGGDSIDDYIKSDNIDHFHRINDGTYRETSNDTEMITMMPMNQDNGKIFALYSRPLGVDSGGFFSFSPLVCITIF